MFLQECPVAISLVLTIFLFQIGFVATDAVECAAMLAEELIGIGTQQFLQLGTFRLVLDKRVLKLEVTRVIIRLQLVERLQVPNARLSHLLYVVRGWVCIEPFVELQHFAVCENTIVVDDRCRLHIRVG